MSAKFHQISLKETFSECQDLFTDDAPSFFQLLDEHLDLESFIPDSFFNAFYRSLGRKSALPSFRLFGCPHPSEDSFHSYRFLAYPFS